MLRDVGEPLLGRRKRGLTRRAGGRAGEAADALANEVRRGSPDRHCSTDEGGCCLQGSPGEACDRGHGRGSRGASGGRGDHPPGGRDNGGGRTGPEGLHGGSSRERHTGFLVAAARGVATSPRDRRRHRRVLGSTLALERAAALAPARPVSCSGSSSASSPKRRHWSWEKKCKGEA
jgi:hypothetical protein